MKGGKEKKREGVNEEGREKGRREVGKKEGRNDPFLTGNRVYKTEELH